MTDPTAEHPAVGPVEGKGCFPWLVTDSTASHVPGGSQMFREGSDGGCVLIVETESSMRIS